MTFDEKINAVIAVATAVVTISSLLASGVNWLIRVYASGGGKVPPFILALASGLNVASVNLDKAVQQVNMARGVSTTSTGGVIPATVPTAVPPLAMAPSTEVAPTEAPKL